ncbi:hypothetical protein [uncultured Acetatifactor sp.]|uniref:hypothetical protein n=1 Tax=uncultured Acetatifactor sp. TaxID=1671927 RepID=UPI002612C70B|nr:hypothetical protein [uncultured Acetatifactor sp.]
MTKARVNIETALRRYRPGEAITEQLSEADLAHFRERNFIIEEDGGGGFPVDGAAQDGNLDGWPDGISGIGGAEMGLDADGAAYKDEAELNRMNKEEIVEYAAEIGLELDKTRLKTDLVSAVLNYVGEKSEEK